MFLHHPVQVDGCLQRFIVLGHLVQLRKPVNGEALGVELLFGIQALPFRRHAPVHATVFVIAEMVQEPVPRMHGRHQVLRVFQRRIGGRETPDEAGVQDNPAGGII